MKYAAYGSNLHPRRLVERISTARLAGTSLLPDWSLHFHKRSLDGSGKCNIIRGGDGVHIAVFDISSDDEAILDRIEGVGIGYSKIVLDVPGFGGCMSYAAQSTHIDDTLIPYDWYMELVLEGALALRLPEEYRNSMRSREVQPDPDTDRNARRWATVDRVRAATQGMTRP